MQVKGVLDKEEVLFAKTQSYLYGAHVVVGTPDCLAELSQQPNAQPVMAHVQAVAVDEVDACFEVGLKTVSKRAALGHASVRGPPFHLPYQSSRAGSSSWDRICVLHLAIDPVHHVIAVVH